MQISKNNYRKILEEIQLSIELARNKITRNKVEMAWKIGKIIDESLPKELSEKYGKNLIEQLEKDTSISKKVLYKMRSFFQTYPKLPKNDPKLNWSHYRVLSGIRKDEERKVLEDMTRENSWDSKELQIEAAKRKNKSPNVKQKEKNSKIQPSRGKVFTYKIVEVIGSDKKFFDCGFGIFREVNQPLPQGAQVILMKDSKAVKSAATPKQVYTYKAFLKRIVDGDTIHANIDLGFGIFHEEIIRLAKINAAEGKTDDGKTATLELKKLLESVSFFILKSIKTDIFNRYVADIFLPEKGETDLQRIADEGVYLNQLLLDHGVAEVF